MLAVSGRGRRVPSATNVEEGSPGETRAVHAIVKPSIAFGDGGSMLLRTMHEKRDLTKSS